MPELGGTADKHDDAGADERWKCDWWGRGRVAVLFGGDNNDGSRAVVFVCVKR